MSSRPARTRTQSTNYGGDSDSEQSDAEDTPKPKKGSKKKRISDVFVPGDDEVETRTPLGSMNMNDDAAEKRRRRKSLKLPPPTVDSVESQPADSQGTPRANGNTRPNPLNVVEDAPAVKVPLDVMSSNFEEWMKMATDNKINPTNSWSFALIDYFHDMSLLRNMTDNSINFQKASCTLDGCVKIWTSRVESVGTETFKLVSDLASGGRGTTDSAIDAEDDDDSNGDGSKKRTKAHRPEATLAKSASQLRSKKLDLEFTVDPLFKKTCADFDESGAQGLLMNHLSLGLGGSLRVVFDAGDSAGAGGGEDEDEEPEEPEDLIDISYLRKEFIPSLDILDGKAISHSLEAFSFQKDAFDVNDITLLDNTNFNMDSQDDDSVAGDDGITYDDQPIDFGGDAGGDHVEDFFVGDQAVQDDYGDFGDGDTGPGEGDMYTPVQGNEGGPRPVGVYEPFDPRRIPNERDLVMAMTGADGEGGMMDYFDQGFMKNWAGPEHWKLRKPVRKVVEASDTTAPKAKREKKEAFKIDFSQSLETPISELFAPVKGKGGIDLPVTKTWASRVKKSSKRKGNNEQEIRRSDQTLPNDMHFSSRQLVTLFLKPKFSLKMRGHRVRINETDGEVDENFWAQAAADQAAGLRGDDADETADGGAIPFNTQFFHDDYDDGPGFDDVYEGDAAGPVETTSAEDQDLLAATQGQGRKIRPEFVNYTKRAKRVDVRKLKENIWKGLNIVVSHGKPVDEEGDVSMTSEPPTNPSEPRVFESVISDLKQTYPKEKMEEISTSFCFICLLHLANEQGLKIEVDNQRGREADEFTTEGDVDPGEDKKVGDLWALKVYRDPDATPAA